jgi:DNA polymerase
VTQQHGTFVESPLAPLVTATVHPSSILRTRTDEERREVFDGLVRDLRVVRRALAAA